MPVIFATGAAGSGAGFSPQRQRELLGKKLLPSQAGHIQRHKFGEVTFKHRGDFFASIKAEIAPKMIRSQAGVSDDGREAPGIIGVDSRARMLQRERSERGDKLRVFLCD